MDGLRIDESLRHGLQPPQQQQQGGKEMLAKTPRRGLGLMINEAKTPISRAIPSSATRKTNRAPTFEVFEDTEEVTEKPAERACSSPIEGVSRLPSSPHSPLFGLENGEEDTILMDELGEKEDVVGPLGDFNNISIDIGAIELGIEKWDEYPPIEACSRIDDGLEDFRDDYADIEDVQLIEDRPEHLEIGASCKFMTTEELDRFIEEYVEGNELDIY